MAPSTPRAVSRTAGFGGDVGSGTAGVVPSRTFQCINSGVRGPVPAGALAPAAVAWFALAVLAPVLPAALAAAVYTVGSLICHQMPDRSFHWPGAQLAVCARCT